MAIAVRALVIRVDCLEEAVGDMALGGPVVPLKAHIFLSLLYYHSG